MKAIKGLCEPLGLLLDPEISSIKVIISMVQSIVFSAHSVRAEEKVGNMNKYLNKIGVLPLH